MCHVSCIIFSSSNIIKEEVEGKKVIEVGSYDINGSMRKIIKSLHPKIYVGTDIEKGPGVDLVCKAENLVSKFGKNSFDVVICNEVLEHTVNYKAVISNMKNICRPGGIMIITTRSYGFIYHPFPYDAWRYELSDMKKIFSDFEILKLEKDEQAPGVFIKLKKPLKYKENNLGNIQLYSMVVKRRTNEITEKDLHKPLFIIRHTFYSILSKIYYKLKP